MEKEKKEAKENKWAFKRNPLPKGTDTSKAFIHTTKWAIRHGSRDHVCTSAVANSNLTAHVPMETPPPKKRRR